MAGDEAFFNRDGTGPEPSLKFTAFVY
jgi:hypothetical protein